MYLLNKKYEIYKTTLSKLKIYNNTLTLYTRYLRKVYTELYHQFSN